MYGTGFDPRHQMAGTGSAELDSLLSKAATFAKEQAAKLSGKGKTLLAEVLKSDSGVLGDVRKAAAARKGKPVAQVTELDIIEYLASIPASGIEATLAKVADEKTGSVQTTILLGAAIIGGALLLGRRR